MAATSAYLAGTDSNDLELSYAIESTWGTSPTAVNYQKFRVNSESFAEQKSRTRPPELRSDGQAAAAVTQDLQAGGSVQFGMSYDNVDELIACALNGEWTADLNIESGNIAAADTSSDGSEGTFTGAAGEFDDVEIGQWIKVAGFSTEGANGYFRVTDINTDGSEITVSPAPADDVGGTDETITITGSMLRNATTFRSVSIQKRFSSSLGFIYPGTFFVGGQLNAARGQFFSGQLDALCKNETKAATAIGTGFDAAPTNRVMDTVGHFQGLRKDDAAVTSKIMSLNTSFVREGANLAFALGSESAQGVGSKGTLTVNGTMEVFFADYDLYDAYKAETGLLISYRVTDGAGNTYVVTIPELVIGQATIVAGGPNQSVMAQFPWAADPSDTYDCSIQIDRMAGS